MIKLWLRKLIMHLQDYWHIYINASSNYGTHVTCDIVKVSLYINKYWHGCWFNWVNRWEHKPCWEVGGFQTRYIWDWGHCLVGLVGISKCMCSSMTLFKPISIHPLDCCADKLDQPTIYHLHTHTPRPFPKSFYFIYHQFHSWVVVGNERHNIAHL